MKMQNLEYSFFVLVPDSFVCNRFVKAEYEFISGSIEFEKDKLLKLVNYWVFFCSSELLALMVC